MNIICKKCEEESDIQVWEIKSLDEFGKQKITQIISPYCYPCRDLMRAQEDARQEKAIQQEKEDRFANWLRTSGIPHKFQRETFETFIDRGGNTEKIKGICFDYADNFPIANPVGYKSLGLLSPDSWGVGKSHLACAITRFILNKYSSVRPTSPVYYTTEQALLRRIRSTFNRNNDSETEDMVYQHLIKVPLLVVDDLGKESMSDPRFLQRAWFSIINGRYENELPMVITTNLTLDGLETHLGGSRRNEASFDRLWEMVGSDYWEILAMSKRRE